MRPHREVSEDKTNEVTQMTKVIEAIEKDGSHALLPDTLIRGFVDAAISAANGNQKRAMKYVGQTLANFMYVRGYKRLTEIRYTDGEQHRIVIMQASNY